MMGLTEDQVRQIMAGHDAWVDVREPMWAQMDATYARRFWSLDAHKNMLQANMQEEDNQKWHYVQMDALRPWVVSYMAGLFYKGLKSSGSTGNVGEVAKPDVVEATTMLVNEWLEAGDIAEVGNLGFQSALMYDGTGAFLLWNSEPKGQKPDPMKLTQIEHVQPWNLVFDRTCTSVEKLQYIGRLRYMSADEFEREFEKRPDAGFIGDKYEPVTTNKADTTGSATAESELTRRGVWVRVLDLFDLTDEWMEKVDDGEVERCGSFSSYLLPTRAGGSSSAGTVKRVQHLPIPYEHADGSPLVNLLPIVVDAVPSRPLENIAPATAVYEVACEYNVCASVLATQAAIRSCEIVTYDPKRLSDSMKTALRVGAPSIYAELSASAESIDEVFQVLKREPLPSTLMEYRKFLEDALVRVSGTTGMARGDTLNYASATEAEAIRNYNDTAVGLTKSKVDRVFSRICLMFRSLLSAALEVTDRKSVPVRTRDDKSVSMTIAKLQAPMKFALADSSTSAGAERQERLDYGTGVKILLEMLALLKAARDSKDKPTEDALRKLYDRGVRLYGLPDTMLSDAILKNVEATPDKLAASPVGQALGQHVGVAPAQVAA